MANISAFDPDERSYNAFEQLRNSLSISSEGLIAMLEAYFDESGTHGGKSGAVTVAGFAAPRERWAAFALEWYGFLKQENVSCFHRTHLECFHGEFARDKGWDEARRDRVVREAQTIIGKYVTLGFAHSVIKADYDEIVTGEVRTKLGAQYYTFCAQSCMRKIAAWAGMLSHNEAINYFFEAGAKGEGELALMMGKVSKRKEARAAFRLGSLSFAQKCDEVIDDGEDKVLFPGLLQLQAADILAYEVYKLMESFVLANPRRPMRESMLHLLQLPFRLEMTHHDKGELIKLVERVESGDLTYVY